MENEELSNPGLLAVVGCV